jgi:hypothetical protein
MKRAKGKLNRIRDLSLLAVITLGIAMTSGCVIAVDENGPFNNLVDLEVSWTINGSDSASLCGVYGVNTWLLEVRGPESRNVVLDCRDNYWSSENDLLLLPEGSYDVRLTALDGGSAQSGSMQTSLYLWDDGRIERLHLDMTDVHFF